METTIESEIREAENALEASYSVMPYDESALLYTNQAIARLLIVIAKELAREVADDND
jgi:hypothetical protein